MAQAPRIAAIQDVSGFGRCSMTVILPVLAAMGGQCCPLLTAWAVRPYGIPAQPTCHFFGSDRTDGADSAALGGAGRDIRCDL